MTSNINIVRTIAGLVAILFSLQGAHASARASERKATGSIPQQKMSVQKMPAEKMRVKSDPPEGFIHILGFAEANDLYAFHAIEVEELARLSKLADFYAPFLEVISAPSARPAKLPDYQDLVTQRSFVSPWMSGDQIDNSFAEILASTSEQVGRIMNQTGRCLAGVATTLVHASQTNLNFHNLPIDMMMTTSKKAYSAGRSADQFLQWAKENPVALCQVFKMRSSADLSKGYVALYKRGSCGFSATFGHIEIISGKSTACSDHCRKIRYECQPDLILAPVKSCDSVHYDTVMTAHRSKARLDI